MILFFGTRPGKPKSIPISDVSCDFCDQTNTLTVHTRTNYFHLFWLPLFKIGTFRQVECSHCKKVYFKEDFTDSMNKALETL